VTAARAIALLVNPHAAGGRPLRVLGAVEGRLRALGLPFRTERTDSLLHGCALAREAAARGEIPVTLSGDGLIGAVAGALRDVPGAVLGVLPGGRGNDFARMAGIPLDAEAAVEVLAHGTPRAVDLGEAGGRTFLGIASLGFDSEANRIANEAPAALGRLVYVYGALRALAAWQEARFTVDVDGERVEFDATGWFARCMQHEYDHLNGTLYVDRLDERQSKKARKAVKRNGWGKPGSSWLPGVDKDPFGHGEDEADEYADDLIG
jgi:diacylglycerol kinase family enzyme